MDTNIKTPIQAKHFEELLLHNGTLYEPFATDGFVGWKPRQTRTGEPMLTWTGGKIPILEPSKHHPHGLWNEVLSFFRWADTDEAQVRLYYDKATGDWRAWAFPQEGIGMTTKELPDHPDWAAQTEALGVEYQCYGTIHSHCHSSAFQSGTDKHNEESQNGIHLTIGDVDKENVSVHGRVYMHKREYTVDWNQWFDIEPIEIPNTLLIKFLMEKANMKDGDIHSANALYQLRHFPKKDVVPYPEQWQKNMVKPSWRNGSGQMGFNHRVTQWSDQRTFTPTTTLEIDALEVEMLRDMDDLRTEMQLSEGFGVILVKEMSKRKVQPMGPRDIHNGLGEKFIWAIEELIGRRYGGKFMRAAYLYEEWKDVNCRLLIDAAEPADPHPKMMPVKQFIQAMEILDQQASVYNGDA